MPTSISYELTKLVVVFRCKANGRRFDSERFSLVGPRDRDKDFQLIVRTQRDSGLVQAYLYTDRIEGGRDDVRHNFKLEIMKDHQTMAEIDLANRIETDNSRFYGLLEFEDLGDVFEKGKFLVLRFTAPYPIAVVSHRPSTKLSLRPTSPRLATEALKRIGQAFDGSLRITSEQTLPESFSKEVQLATKGVLDRKTSKLVNHLFSDIGNNLQPVKVQGRELMLIKKSIKSRVPVLYRLMRETKEPLVLKDISYNRFIKFLRFVYLEKVELDDLREGLEVLAIARKFDFGELYLAAEQFIFDRLETELDSIGLEVLLAMDISGSERIAQKVAELVEQRREMQGSFNQLTISYSG